MNMEIDTDGTSNALGDIYEVRCCMLLALLGYIRKHKQFYLRYQVNEKESGKFDDILFYDGETLYFFQLKHQEKPEKKENKITRTDLFSNTYKDEYNLLKYVISVHKYIQKEHKDKIFVASVFTNAGFDIDENNEMTLKYFRNELIKDLVKDIPKIKLNLVDLDKNSILCDFSNLKCFKFEDANIVKILKRQAEVEVKELQKLSKAKKPKPDEETLIETLEKLSEDDIKKALEHIIYSVEAPNVLEVEEIIKNSIKRHFQLHTVDMILIPFQKTFKSWCDYKTPIHKIQNDEHIISFDVIKEFFKCHDKRISYGEFRPRSSFVGRKKQLEKIRDNLKENSNIIISQTLAISGLGGIGKTALTREFIKQYGQSDFYGRVIWIQAESDQTVEGSFSKLAEALKIEDRQSIKTIIDDVFEYFRGYKVLFVFDNYDSSTEDNRMEVDGYSENHLVNYCRELASNQNKSDRPYFIFTSRNRECFLDVISIDLGTLTDKEACDLIVHNLMGQILSDEDVKNLAKKLQNFPLALQQATAYIKETQKTGNFGIDDYLKLFDDKTKELLNHPYLKGFNEYEITTFVTWNVTVDAIEKDENNGQNAIRIFQYMSYLYPDNIDCKLFLSLLDQDQVGEAILLLAQFSMITETQPMFYQIHRLVQRVIRIKFDENKEQNLRDTWKLIDPAIYEYCEEKNVNDIHLYNLDTYDFYKYYHYLSILPLTDSNSDLHKKIKLCVNDYSDVTLMKALVLNDDETIADIPQENAISFARSDAWCYVSRHENIEAKRLIEYLDINHCNNLIKKSLEYFNFEIFKFLIDKGANLSCLNFESMQTVHDVINGNSDPLKAFLSQERSNNNEKMIEESLLLATVCNQRSIVELLIGSDVRIDFEFYEIGWSPVVAAINLKFYHILKILLKYFDEDERKQQLKTLIEYLFSTSHKRSYFIIDKVCLEIIFEKYFNVFHDINQQHLFNDFSFLCMITDLKHFRPQYEGFVRYLLNKGANPFMIEKDGENALLNIFKIIKTKFCLYDVYEEKKSEIPNDIFLKICKEYLFNNIKENKIDLINFKILEQIDDKNILNEKGETLLISYLKNRKFDYVNNDSVKNIIEAGVNVDATDYNGKNALYYSSQIRNDGAYKVILEKCKDNENLNHYIECLFENAKNDNLETTFFTIMKKINNPNIRNEEGETLLRSYLKNRRLDIASGNSVKKLIEAGIDINTKDDSGKNALYYSLEIYNDNVYKTILEYVKEFDNDFLNDLKESLFKNAKNDNIGSTFFTILDQLREKNVRNEEGETLLICYLKNRSSKLANKGVVEKLMEAGIDASAIDYKSKTALYYSLEVSNDDAYKTILDSIKDVDDELLKESLFMNLKNDNIGTTFFTVLEQISDKNICNKNGETLLINYLKHRNSEFAKKDVVEKLLEAGINVNLKDENGKNALYYALKISKDDLYRTVLNYVEEVDNEFLNLFIESLCKIVKHDYVETIFFRILDQLSEKNIQNEEGETLLICYLKNRNAKFANKDVVEKLIEAGIDINAKDSSGKNALYYSLKVYNDDAYKTILGHVKEVDKDFSNNCKEILFESIKQYQVGTTFFTILEQMSEKNIRNEEGDTLLISYLKNRSSKLANKDVVEKLIDAGIDINAKDYSGKNAFYYSFEIYNDDAFKTILNHIKKDDDEITNQYIKSLFKIVKYNNNNIGTTFFTILEQINDKSFCNTNEDGETLLISYLKNRSSEIAYVDDIEKLIKAGVDVNAIDSSGKNALYYSSNMYNEDLHETIFGYVRFNKK